MGGVLSGLYYTVYCLSHSCRIPKTNPCSSIIYAIKQLGVLSCIGCINKGVHLWIDIHCDTVFTVRSRIVAVKLSLNPSFLLTKQGGANRFLIPHKRKTAVGAAAFSSLSEALQIQYLKCSALRIGMQVLSAGCKGVFASLFTGLEILLNHS